MVKRKGVGYKTLVCSPLLYVMWGENVTRWYMYVRKILKHLLWGNIKNIIQEITTEYFSSQERD